MTIIKLSPEEWANINKQLNGSLEQYGFPPQSDDFLTLGSFNIRKLGKGDNRTEEEWQFLAKICCQFDLLAIQEVMDDLEGIQYLKDLVQKENPNYRVLLSDATGTFPGEKGLAERLCFLYNTEYVQRTEVASDITYDRSKLVATLYENMDVLNKSFEEFKKKVESYHMGLRSTKPSLKLPVFLSFIRQPYCAAFTLGKKGSDNPYKVMAVNAHLLFGNYMSDREQEFSALMEWIIERVKQENKTYYDDFILLGDLNLNFDNPEKDFDRVAKYLQDFDSNEGNTFDVNFPFLEPHPNQEKVFKTNARASETFDQIGLFINDETFLENLKMQNGFDYGVFDFVKLFAEVIAKKPVNKMSKSERKKFYARFEHSVSDHLPIWIKIPVKN